jgi:NitT/TauT family transport system substrate-binding protein
MKNSFLLTRRLCMSALLAASLGTAASTHAVAEVSEVKLAMQFGLGHFPMMIMQHHKLIESEGKALGLNLTTKWFQLAGSAAVNDALLSSSADFTSGGLTGIAVLWSASKGKVKAAAAVDSMPFYLNTSNPKIKSLKDFTDKDKIGLPAVKVSPQAIVLQMAAQKQLGDYSKLDHLTVTMKHPDAMAAVLSGSGAVNSHFGFPPYQQIELKDPKVHRVLSSFDIVGPATVVVMATRKEFHDKNPKTYKAVVSALTKAIDYINSDKRRAAKEYIEITKDKKLSEDELVKLLESPDMKYSVTPSGSLTFVNFMYERGILKTKPSSWKELYFPNVHNLPGAS